MRIELAMFAAVVLLGSPMDVRADPTGQPLSIVIHGDGARATQLSAYDPGTPIVLNVTETSDGAVDGVSAVATGPDGESTRTSLARAANGTFSGTLMLHDPGAWRLRLTAHTGSTNIDTAPVTLDVQTLPPSNAWQIGLAVGATIFIVVGGTGFLILRRTMGAPAPAG